MSPGLRIFGGKRGREGAEPVHRRLPHRPGDRLVRRLPAHPRRDRRLGRTRRRRPARGLEAAAAPAPGPGRRARRDLRDAAMKALDFWFDPVSPYAYLAFERLPEALAGLSYTSATGRSCSRRCSSTGATRGRPRSSPSAPGPSARSSGWRTARALPLETPARHPFNPIALSRLAWATAPEGATPNRHACATILRPRLAGRRRRCRGSVASRGAARAARAPPGSGERPRSSSCFATPPTRRSARASSACRRSSVDGRLFWGLDALPMLAAYLRGDPWFDGPDWQLAGAPRPGVVR